MKGASWWTRPVLAWMRAANLRSHSGTESRIETSIVSNLYLHRHMSEVKRPQCCIRATTGSWHRGHRIWFGMLSLPASAAPIRKKCSGVGSFFLQWSIFILQAFSTDCCLGL
jgi:hypothetical protein